MKKKLKLFKPKDRMKIKEIIKRTIEALDNIYKLLSPMFVMFSTIYILLLHNKTDPDKMIGIPLLFIIIICTSASIHRHIEINEE